MDNMHNSTNLGGANPVDFIPKRIIGFYGVF